MESHVSAPVPVAASHATDALFAWLSSPHTDSIADADVAWKTQLHEAVGACDDDVQALTALLQRLEHFAGHSARTKWTLLLRELQRMHADDELLDHATVRTQLLRLQLRFPLADTIVHIPHGEKRLSAPTMRMLNSLEPQRPGRLLCPTRSLRRAHTTDDPDARPFPLLEPRPTLSQRSGASVASSLTRSFLTRMSSVLQGGFEETFFCFICFENVPMTQAFALSRCGHQFCRACLTMYLDVKIRDGEVYPTCFHDVEDACAGRRLACAAPVIPPDIEAVVSSATWTKYERFKFNKDFQYARQCPFCAHSQNCRGPEDPECVCERCKRVFCFTHSNAHDGGTCADFERRNLETEKLTRSAIARIAKPCPGCQSSVEKNGGCNHMTCVMCQTSFCWICGQVVDNVALPNHFAWWNIAGCAGQQLVDVANQSGVERVGWMLFRALFLVVCVPIATLITLVLTVLTGCCIPCVCWIHEDPTHTFLGTVNTIALYVQLLIAVVTIGPISVLATSIRCVRRCFCSCCWSVPPRDVALDHSVVVLENDYELALEDEIDL